MFKSIFAKQLTFYMSALLVSFIILAVAVSMAFNSYFISQKAELLDEQARRISNIYKATLQGSLEKKRAVEEMDYEINVLKEYMNTSLIIVGRNNYVEYVTKDVEECLETQFIVKDFAPIKDGEQVITKGLLGGIYPEQVLTVGNPVIEDGVVVGAVLLSSSIPELNKTSSDMFSIILLCLMISAVLAFILIFLLSRTMTKPLHEMNVAAKVIASGDFEKRIHVNSQDEVGQLAESFNNMAESLYEQEQLRRVFISNVSHDLRSPLTSIRGFLQAILDGTVPPEKIEYYLNIVMEETERLSKLTHEIIDLNQIQSPSIELDKKAFDINDLIRRTVLTFEATAKSKNLLVNLNFENEHDFVLADIEKIQRVIFNLIDNAIKFTADSGVVTIETSVRDKKVTIKISDNGKGLNPEDQKYVFDRFYKVDTSRGIDRKGSGLGLSIVMAFVRAHNETVMLQSEEGKGCTFSFELPRIIMKKNKNTIEDVPVS